MEYDISRSVYNTCVLSSKNVESDIMNSVT